MYEIAEYLRRAAEADAHVTAARDIEVKRDWQRLADQWRALARQAGHLAVDAAERKA